MRDAERTSGGLLLRRLGVVRDGPAALGARYDGGDEMIEEVQPEGERADDEAQPEGEETNDIE